MRPVELARQACRQAGIEPFSVPVRGGTDGSRLTELGVPTPNVFTGMHEIHGPLEWISLQDMAAATEMGDGEAYDAVHAAFMADHPPVMHAGVLHHPGVSTQAHSVAFCSRAGRTNAIHDLVAEHQHDPAGRRQIGAEGHRHLTVAAEAPDHDHSNHGADHCRHQDDRQQHLPAEPGSEGGE